jgi:hypothetical protein
MRPSRLKMVESVVCHFALWVNDNEDKLQKSYTDYGIDPNELNFVEYSVMKYLEEYKELVSS